MEAFINGICAISPQITWKGDNWFGDIKEYEESRFLKCIEPLYSELLDPLTVRRMSRIIKMGAYAALKSLASAGISKPDAIITGTGFGCLEDTGKFISSLYLNEEKLLNPTPFIQSTHNSIGAAIALILKCTNYNNTFGHRGFSFENGLLDAMMLMNEGQAENALVGAIDEITPPSFQIMDRLGLWKKKNINNLRLLDHKTKGTLAGEGAAFFALCRSKTATSMAKLADVHTFYKPENYQETEHEIQRFLLKNGVHPEDLNLVIMGLNGDVNDDQVYYTLANSFFSHVPGAFFKHLCGEYTTSSSFAMLLAADFIRIQQVPDCFRLDSKPIKNIRNVLIYNHLRQNNHALLLLTSC
jgi:3-oxoacyl-[acyl-carrier-protein] synthase II